MDPVPQPVALVTGAGSGIGRAIARALAGRGYAVVLAGRDEGRLRETGAALAGAWAALATDLGDPAQAAAMVDAALARFGRVDVLVNAAGRLVTGSIAEHTAETVTGVLAVNAAGPLLAVARLWPAFERQRSGCVINISSCVSVHRLGGPLAYTASKGALDMLTVCCALEGRRCGVRAFSINPGSVETGMLRRFADEAAVPRSRALPPEAVAAVVLDCLDGRWDSRNGDTILVTTRHPRGERVRLLHAAARRARRALGNVLRRSPR